MLLHLVKNAYITLRYFRLSIFSATPHSMEEILKIIAVLTAATVGFTISGVAGFGGGLVALPVLVWVFGIKEAVPIISIAQLF